MKTIEQEKHFEIETNQSKCLFEMSYYQEEDSVKLSHTRDSSKQYQMDYDSNLSCSSLSHRSETSNDYTSFDDYNSEYMNKRPTSGIKAVSILHKASKRRYVDHCYKIKDIKKSFEIGNEHPIRFPDLNKLSCISESVLHPSQKVSNLHFLKFNHFCE